jgi:SulP family sulfate permease
LTGLKAEGHALFSQLSSLLAQLGQVSLATVVIGVFSLGFLFWVRRGLKPLLRRIGFAVRPADMLAKAGPVVAIAASTFAVWWLGLDTAGVAVVGAVPQSLPPFTLPVWDFALWQQLAVPALLISVVGFVESVSVGQTLAAKRRQRIEPDQELVALLARRFGYMDAAARIKPSRSDVRDEARKAQVIANASAAAAAAGLPPGLAENLWETLVETSIAHELDRWDKLRTQVA